MTIVLADTTYVLGPTRGVLRDFACVHWAHDVAARRDDVRDAGRQRHEWRHGRAGSSWIVLVLDQVPSVPKPVTTMLREIRVGTRCPETGPRGAISGEWDVATFRGQTGNDCTLSMQDPGVALHGTDAVAASGVRRALRADGDDAGWYAPSFRGAGRARALKRQVVLVGKEMRRDPG